MALGLGARGVVSEAPSIEGFECVTAVPNAHFILLDARLHADYSPVHVGLQFSGHDTELPAPENGG